MSRIGKKLINIPSGVKIAVETANIKVEGPKGKLDVPLPAGITANLDEKVVSLNRKDETKEQRALHGLTRALLANAVNGVSEGFVKKLDIVGVGYRAEVRGRYLNLSLGHSHPVEFPIPEDLKISVEREPRQLSNYVTTISVAGADRYMVGQAAADIRSLRPPDAYKGKGVRYSTEIVRLKVGKKGA